jgi:hypothetical protein
MCVPPTNNQPSPAPAGLRLADGSTFLTPTNIRFRYRYRDASNYKQHGEAIFTNAGHLSLLEIETRIRASLHDGEFFIARQIHLEELFFDILDEDDHPRHEFSLVEATTDPAFDLEQAKQSGWDEMNVREDLKQQMEKQKEILQKRGGALT